MSLNPLSWLRWSMLALVVLALLVATLAGTVDAGHIHPHSETGRTITGATAPVIAPVRHTVAVGGGGLGLGVAFWFGVTAVVTGALAASCLEWLLFPTRALGDATDRPTRRGIVTGITVVFAVVLAFVIVGLWGSLSGAPRAAWWMAPFSLSTSWAVDGLAHKVPRIALLNLAAGALYAVLRVGRWWAVRT